MTTSTQCSLRYADFELRDYWNAYIRIMHITTFNFLILSPQTTMKQ